MVNMSSMWSGRLIPLTPVDVIARQSRSNLGILNLHIVSKFLGREHLLRHFVARTDGLYNRIQRNKRLGRIKNNACASRFLLQGFLGRRPSVAVSEAKSTASGKVKRDGKLVRGWAAKNADSFSGLE